MSARLQIEARSAALLLGILWASVAQADWPTNGAPISVLPCEELPTAAVADGSGGMFVFWTDNRTCGRNDVYVQRLVGSGAVAAGWPISGVPVCALTGGQGSAAAVSDGQHGAIVVWHDGRSGEVHLYAQRVGPDGARLWSPEGVPVCEANGDQGGFRILSDQAGGAFVAWMDTRRGLDDGPPHHHPLFDLFAQRLGPQGSKLWPAAGVPVAANAMVQTSPNLVTDGGSGVLIAWLDQRGPAYLQHMNADGAAQLAQDGVAVPGRFYGLMAPDGSGGIFSTFMYGPDTQQDLYAQRIDGTGALIWPVNGVLVAAANFDQRPNAIIEDGDGGAFIAWHDLRNGQDWDIYVQRITADGAAASGWPASGLPVCAEPGFQIYPRAVSDEAGGCILTWYDARDATTAYDIYAQRITAGGATFAGWPTNGSSLCQASGNQTEPFAVPDGAGGAFVTWNDYREYADVYAQRVSASGVVGETDPAVAVGAPDRPRFSLGAPYPNPLVGNVLAIPIWLPDGSPAELALFDLQGRLVVREHVAIGLSGSIIVRLETPDRLPPGAYTVRLARAGEAISRKVTLVR